MQFSELTILVENLLSSTNANSNASDLVFDGIKAGHIAILPWVENIKEATISGSDGRKFILPDDVFTVEGIVDPLTYKVLGKTSLTMGSVWGASIVAEKNWMLMPNKTISLSGPTQGTELNIIYKARWAVPDSISDAQTFVLEIPEYAIYAVAYYAASYVLAVYSTDTAALRQYNTRMDSGAPEENPLQKSSEFYMKRFTLEVGRMPSVNRIVEYD